MKHERFYIIAISLMLIIGYVPVLTNAADYFGKFPPTPAWQDIEIITNNTIPFTTQTTVNATSYNDRLYIITDGSISINITEYIP